MCGGGGGGFAHINCKQKIFHIYNYYIYFYCKYLYNKFNGPFGLKEKEGEWRGVE